MAIRDVYNQLIDRMQGVRGIVRSGGDAAPARIAGPTPTEALVAFHSGVVRGRRGRHGACLRAAARLQRHASG